MLGSIHSTVSPGISVAAGKKPIVLNRSHLTPKRIAAAVALALAAGSGSAWAAGLGRLTVQSALGQPLRAEVEITAMSREEAASLNARLAEPAAFRQAGLEFNPALRGLRFAIERRDSGRPIVRITSTQPLNEPFVDLMVELNWAAGKFVREYTFLLDPPELRIAGRELVDGGQGQLVTAATPAAASKPTEAAQPAAAPAAAAPVSPAPTAQRPRPAPAPTPAARPAATATAPSSVEVKAGDTLTGIATQVGYEGVSLDQALISIYQANPAAFFGSVHQLKAGSTLSVPDRQAMAAIDPAQAREQIRVQTRDFNEYRSRLAESARSVAVAKSGQSVAGSVTAKVEDKGAPAASSDQLRLSKSGPAAAGETVGATGTASSKSGAAVEQSVARDAALRESESRVAELEKNVGDLQQLLELKNRQLADLQKQVEAGKALDKAATGTIAKADAVPAAPTAPAPGPVATPAQAPAQAPSAVSPSEPAKPEPAPVAASAPAPAPVEAPKPAPVEAPKARVAPPAPASEPSFVEDLMSNPLMLPGLGAILALGAGYGWYAMRRRRKVEKFEDSLIAAEGFSTNSLFGSTGGQNVDTTSSVFSSSTKDSGVDVHSTEVDPIAEAEVYIAYGREAQAEEILKEALRRQPERQAIRAKLLEIYSGRKDLDAFNRVAGEMHRATGGQNEEWAKVVTMGLALDPDNALYTGLSPAQSADSEAQPAEDAEQDEAADAARTEARRRRARSAEGGGRSRFRRARGDRCFVRRDPPVCRGRVQARRIRGRRGPVTGLRPRSRHHGRQGRRNAGQ